MPIGVGKKRQRYIGFQIYIIKKTGAISRSAMIDAINHKCQDYSQKMGREFTLRLIRFNGQIGIVKCSNTLKDQAIEALQLIDRISTYKVQIHSIATSGTIRALLKQPGMKTLIYS